MSLGSRDQASGNDRDLDGRQSHHINVVLKSRIIKSREREMELDGRRKKKFRCEAKIQIDESRSR